MSPKSGILRKGAFNLNLFNNPLSPCCLINLDLLLLHTVHFDKIVIFSLFVFVNLKIVPF